jgi:hypothetical protein
MVKHDDPRFAAVRQVLGVQFPGAKVALLLELEPDGAADVGDRVVMRNCCDVCLAAMLSHAAGLLPDDLDDDRPETLETMRPAGRS